MCSNLNELNFSAGLLHQIFVILLTSDSVISSSSLVTLSCTRQDNTIYGFPCFEATYVSQVARQQQVRWIKPYRAQAQRGLRIITRTLEFWNKRFFHRQLNSFPSWCRFAPCSSLLLWFHICMPSAWIEVLWIRILPTAFIMLCFIFCVSGIQNKCSAL